MNNFIDLLPHRSDHSRILEEAQQLWLQYPQSNQISLRYRADCEAPLLDGVGTLDNGASEEDFISWSVDPHSYTRQQIEHLGHIQGVRFGRARYMLLQPKTGLTVHRDRERRYHLALSTNQHCWVGCKLDTGIDDPTTPRGLDWHLPADGKWYSVDTTRMHWVYNGGVTPRIHLVLCVLNKI